MSKKHYKAPKHSSGRKITTPSWFGSHGNMIVDTPSGVQILDSEVVCKDDEGLYITNKSMIDSGLADVNRYSNESKRIYIADNIDKIEE